MRAWVLTAIAVTALFCSVATRAKAEDAQDFATLDAALTLWEFALSENRADLALAALEVVAELAPTGSQIWVSQSIAEVRLLALGAPDILERVESLAVSDEVAEMALLVSQSDPATVVLPDHLHLAKIRIPLGWQLENAQTNDGRACILNMGRIRDCRSDKLSGEITFTWSKRAPQGVIAYALVPVQAVGADQADQ